MKLIDEIDGKILGVWKFSSVWFSTVAAACSGAIATYEGFKAIDPPLVRHVPLWIMCALAGGAVVFTFASIIARGIAQPRLREPKGCDDPAEQA